ncbi:MAG: hypothetical protein IKG25_05430 [Mogibacterium sp.]|nr:hypothetical protein [Mogibacterium sp.]
MRKITNAEKVNGELAMRRLSKKAADMYSGTDPLTIAEYEEDGQTLYSMRGALGNEDGMTFEAIQKMLEELADEMADDEE